MEYTITKETKKNMKPKAKSKFRVPYGWMPRLMEMTGLTQPPISRNIRDGNTDHPAWKAYMKLLQEAAQKKTQEQAKAEQLLSELAA